MMSTFTRAAAVALSQALALASVAGQTASGQPAHVAPPMGVPFGRSIGPPSDNVEDFVGTWKISWTGSVGTSCPCQGTLTIDEALIDAIAWFRTHKYL